MTASLSLSSSQTLEERIVGALRVGPLTTRQLGLSYGQVDYRVLDLERAGRVWRQERPRAQGGLRWWLPLTQEQLAQRRELIRTSALRLRIRSLPVCPRSQLPTQEEAHKHVEERWGDFLRTLED